MPFPVIPAIAAGASILGGAVANRGRGRAAHKQRKFARREAEVSRGFSSAEAGKQRSFQERMRNTEWQAGIADMEAAGLNPALAYSQGGAGSPGGAMGSASMGSAGISGVEDVISPGVSSAMQAKRMQAELAFIKQQADTSLASKYKMDQESRESRAREIGIDWNNILLESQVPGAKNIASFEAGRFGARTRTIRSLLQSVFGSGGAFKAR